MRIRACVCAGHWVDIDFSSSKLEFKQEVKFKLKIQLNIQVLKECFVQRKALFERPYLQQVALSASIFALMLWDLACALNYLFVESDFI